MAHGHISECVTGDMENKISAFATSCYWIMLNIKQLNRVSIERIYHLTNTQSLINTVRQRQLRFLGHILDAWRGAMQKICPVCSNLRQKETRTAEDKLPILFTEAFWGCREWSEPRCNCLISCRSLCLEKICSHLLHSRTNERTNEWWTAQWLVNLPNSST